MKATPVCVSSSKKAVPRLPLSKVPVFPERPPVSVFLRMPDRRQKPRDVGVQRAGQRQVIGGVIGHEDRALGIHMFQKVQVLLAQPIVTWRIRLRASLGGRYTVPS